MKRENIIIFFAIPILLVFLVGCKERPFTVSVRYDTLGALKPNVPVYFEKTRVGYIIKIVSTDRSDYLVEISIVPEHKGKATANSKFYILDDPFDSSRKVLIIEQDPPGGTLLKDGSIVQGEKNQGFFDRFMANFKQSSDDASGKLQVTMRDFKESLTERSHNLNKQMETSLGNINNYFQDFQNHAYSSTGKDDISRLESSLDKFIEEFNSLNREMQNLLREEILPGLRRNLEILRKSLEDKGHEEEIEKINQRLIRISRA